MSRVRPRVETADEAKLSIVSSIERILQSASLVLNYISELLELVIVKGNEDITRALTEIQEQVSELTDYLKENNEGEEIYHRAQFILKLFSLLDASVRDMEPTLRAETAVVMINASSREVMAAEPKAERQEDFRPRFKGFTVDGMRKELGDEFQLRFPIFLGCPVKIGIRGKGFEIHLEPSPKSPIEIEEVTKTLKQIVEQFLERELLDGPLTFMYDVTVYGLDEQPWIDCIIAVPEDSHFR